MKKFNFILFQNAKKTSYYFSTKKQMEKEAIEKSKEQCEENNVYGIQDHCIILSANNQDYSKIDLPTHDDYYNHEEAKPYGNNDEFINFYKNNLEVNSI
jgi:hypothetical protein